ncbi:hypothetical protein GGC47_003150 [Bosea sp. OAE752]|jgi:hypothetical protein|uniref:hypothetical protein n=1 Tax=Bosea sp. OAE752 TaxID=2663873 RepID=UPI0011731923
MCVRPACHIPAADELSPRDYAAWRIARRNLATVAELGALAAFLGAVLIWSSVLSGA